MVRTISLADDEPALMALPVARASSPTATVLLRSP
jgi:hypothetical protein